MEILDKAQSGFKSGKSAIKDLKLTPRQYYRKLRELNESGILVSMGEEYRLSQLGGFLHKLLLSDISGVLLGNQSALLPIEKVGTISQIAVINDYDKLTDFLNSGIEQSKSEILIASRYLDLAVVQRLIYALDRNVKVKTVTNSKVDVASLLKLLGDALIDARPNMANLLIDKSNYKTGEVPFSLAVIDNEIAVFEIPNKYFKSAFAFMDKQAVHILAGLFWELWNHAESLQATPP